MRNKSLTGREFDLETVQAIWEKAHIVPGKDPDLIRKDHCGAWIRRDMFGEDQDLLSFGWTIDHIKPHLKGGTDTISNLQPLQWENNRKKGDDFPYWNCSVSASGDENSYIL